MTTQALLITQCLQNDFVKPLDRFEPRPNPLHIGHEEALRLLGDRPSEGPVSRVMQWAYAQSDSALKLLHIRDWHDANDAQQSDHLKQFGLHCIQNTKGAEFVFEHPPQTEKEVAVINSLTLNDFHKTPLPGILDDYDSVPLKIGLMGVWTDAKITFLAYELKTRYPHFEIAVCSALSASISRQKHFIALEQLEALLGINVFSSIAGFMNFLGNTGQSLIPKSWLTSKRPLIVLDSYPPLNETESKMVRYLFRDSRIVKMSRLGGGFSGNSVFGTQSVDIYGHQQVPHVVKMGAHDAMGRERMAFEKIEGVMGNNAPRITEFAELQQLGALKYRYASMGGGISDTFQSLYQQKTLGSAKENQILDTVFDEQLGKLYQAAVYTPCHLLDYYSFSSQWADSVEQKADAILSMPECPAIESQDLKQFYSQDLDSLHTKLKRQSCFTSYLHGDLNGANIILDKHHNVWLIDFFHTHQGHVLKDLIKFENDLLYIFTPLSADDFLEACAFSDILLGVTDLWKPLPEYQFKSAILNRTYATVKHLRSFYSQYIQWDRDPLQVFIGQLRYAVHTMGFEECSPMQKSWALYMANQLAFKVKSAIEKEHTIELNALPIEDTSPGKLSLTLLPGRKDRKRDLTEDIQRIQSEGVKHIICLITEDEMQTYGVNTLLLEYEKAGFEVYHLPILDQKTPSAEEMRQVLTWLCVRLKRGGHVMTHCVGGLGRTGTLAASYLKLLGHSAVDAIESVRQVRSPRSIETEVQVQFIQDFEP